MPQYTFNMEIPVTVNYSERNDGSVSVDTVSIPEEEKIYRIIDSHAKKIKAVAEIRQKEANVSVTCTRCQNSGFLNINQLIESDWEIAALDDRYESAEPILDWMKQHPESDLCVCDCCGNGEDWYGVRGEHYNDDDPKGANGPYAYNGGLCECH